MQRILNIIFIFILCLVLTGAYAYQFLEHARPCELCLLQRLGMIALASALLLNLRFGIRVEHYGLAILFSVIGGFVSLEQISLHICQEPLSDAVLGLDLYVWSLIIFGISLFAIGMLLIFEGYAKHKPPISWTFWEKGIYWYLFLITFANIITTLYECGLSSCSRH